MNKMIWIKMKVLMILWKMLLFLMIVVKSNVIQFVQITDLNIHQSFTGHTDSVLCVAFNPKKPLQFATGGQDDKAYLHQIVDDKIQSLCLDGHQDSVCGVAFNCTGEYLATIDMNGMIKVWSTTNGHLVKTLEGPEEAEWIRWHNKVGVSQSDD